LRPSSPLRYGRIVFAWIADRNGFRKLRPAVVVVSDQELANDGELILVAITTTFTEPPPEFCVPLPWHPRGHPTTKLTKRSAAVCNWLSIIMPDEIVGFGGDVPAKTMQLIQARVRISGERQE
jgi:mRNA-degrading endonuclease toxin of MazEF toxin-antitoxin module